MNPLFQGHSGTAPETSRKAYGTSQGTNRTILRMILILKQVSSRARRHETLAQKTATTWWQDFTRLSHTVRTVHLQESRKRTVLSVNRISALRIPLQRLKQTNFWWPFSGFAKFHNNINRFFKLSKSLTTTMPTFEGKSLKFELFEDLLQTSLELRNQLIEDDRVNYFDSLMRGDALHTFKNFNGPTQENLGEFLAVFCWKCVKSHSIALGKQKFQKNVFNSAHQNLIDFLDELQKLAKDAFGIAALVIIDQIVYAKMPPHLKK